MAKRKRLPLPADLDGAPHPETPIPSRRAPIADVVGDASAQAALDRVADEMGAARRDGRLVERLPLDVIDTDFLLRDRMVLDPDELLALKNSIAERGQQTPVEVVPLGNGRYGLISGWRRMTALGELHASFGRELYSTVLAFVRQPASVPDAYIAMVEENEIRAPLSTYERARVAFRAAEGGIFPTAEIAVKRLYQGINKTKRSKIRSFLTLCRTLDDVLRFPTELGERLGLALAKAIDRDDETLQRVRAKLAAAQSENAAEEQALLKAAIKAPTQPRKPKSGIEIIEGVTFEVSQARVTVSGEKVDPPFQAAFELWLRSYFRD